MGTPTPKSDRWTKDEVKALTDLVEATMKLNNNKIKPENWDAVATRIPGKSATQCQSKWRRLKLKTYAAASPQVKTQDGSGPIDYVSGTTPIKQEATSSFSLQNNGQSEKKESLKKFFEARLDNILKLSDDEQLELRDEFDLMLMKRLK